MSIDWNKWDKIAKKKDEEDRKKLQKWNQEHAGTSYEVPTSNNKRIVKYNRAHPNEPLKLGNDTFDSTAFKTDKSKNKSNSSTETKAKPVSAKMEQSRKVDKKGVSLKSPTTASGAWGLLNLIQFTGVQSGIYNATDKDPNTTFWQGMKDGAKQQFASFGDDFGQNKKGVHTFSDIVSDNDTIFNFLKTDKDDNVAEKGLKMLGTFGGEILTDPTTFVGGVAKGGASLLKGSGEVATTLTKINKFTKTDDIVRMSKSIDTATDASKVASKADDTVRGASQVADAAKASKDVAEDIAVKTGSNEAKKVYNVKKVSKSLADSKDRVVNYDKLSKLKIATSDDFADTIKRQNPDLGSDAIKFQAQQMADTYNKKIIGFTYRVGEDGKLASQIKDGVTIGMNNLPFSSKIGIKEYKLSGLQKQLLSNQKIAKIGDNTVAPAYQRLSNKIKNTRFAKEFNGDTGKIRNFIANGEQQKAEDLFYSKYVSKKNSDAERMLYDMTAIKTAEDIDKITENMSKKQIKRFIYDYETGTLSNYISYKQNYHTVKASISNSAESSTPKAISDVANKTAKDSDNVVISPSITDVSVKPNTSKSTDVVEESKSLPKNSISHKEEIKKYTALKENVDTIYEKLKTKLASEINRTVNAKNDFHTADISKKLTNNNSFMRCQTYGLDLTPKMYSIEDKALASGIKYTKGQDVVEGSHYIDVLNGRINAVSLDKTYTEADTVLSANKYTDGEYGDIKYTNDEVSKIDSEDIGKLGNDALNRSATNDEIYDTIASEIGLNKEPVASTYNFDDALTSKINDTFGSTNKMLNMNNKEFYDLVRSRTSRTKEGETIVYSRNFVDGEVIDLVNARAAYQKELEQINKYVNDKGKKLSPEDLREKVTEYLNNKEHAANKESGLALARFYDEKYTKENSLLQRLSQYEKTYYENPTSIDDLMGSSNSSSYEDVDLFIDTDSTFKVDNFDELQTNKEFDYDKANLLGEAYREIQNSKTWDEATDYFATLAEAEADGDWFLDPVTKQEFLNKLNESYFNGKIYFSTDIPSTNLLALKWCLDNNEPIKFHDIAINRTLEGSSVKLGDGHGFRDINGNQYPLLPWNTQRGRIYKDSEGYDIIDGQIDNSYDKVYDNGDASEQIHQKLSLSDKDDITYYEPSEIENITKFNNIDVSRILGKPLSEATEEEYKYINAVADMINPNSPSYGSLNQTELRNVIADSIKKKHKVSDFKELHAKLNNTFTTASKRYDNSVAIMRAYENYLSDINDFSIPQLNGMYDSGFITQEDYMRYVDAINKNSIALKFNGKNAKVIHFNIPNEWAYRECDDVQLAYLTSDKFPIKNIDDYNKFSAKSEEFFFARNIAKRDLDTINKYDPEDLVNTLLNSYEAKKIELNYVSEALDAEYRLKLLESLNSDTLNNVDEKKLIEEVASKKERVKLFSNYSEYDYETLDRLESSIADIDNELHKYDGYLESLNNSLNEIKDYSDYIGTKDYIRGLQVNEDKIVQDLFWNQDNNEVLKILRSSVSKKRDKFLTDFLSNFKNNLYGTNVDTMIKTYDYAKYVDDFNKNPSKVAMYGVKNNDMSAHGYKSLGVSANKTKYGINASDDIIKETVHKMNNFDDAVQKVELSELNTQRESLVKSLKNTSDADKIKIINSKIKSIDDRISDVNTLYNKMDEEIKIVEEFEKNARSIQMKYEKYTDKNGKVRYRTRATLAPEKEYGVSDVLNIMKNDLIKNDIVNINDVEFKKMFSSKTFDIDKAHEYYINKVQSKIDNVTEIRSNVNEMEFADSTADSFISYQKTTEDLDTEGISDMLSKQIGKEESVIPDIEKVFFDDSSIKKTTENPLEYFDIPSYYGLEEDKVVELYNMLCDGMSRCARREVEAGRLEFGQAKTLLGRYLPHYYNKNIDISKVLDMVTNSLKGDSDFSELFNVKPGFAHERMYSTMQDAEEAFKRKYISYLFSSNPALTFTDAYNLANKEVSKWINTSLSEIYLTRCLASNDLVFNEKNVKFIIDRFSEEVNSTKAFVDCDNPIVTYQNLHDFAFRRSLNNLINNGVIDTEVKGWKHKSSYTELLNQEVDRVISEDLGFPLEGMGSSNQFMKISEKQFNYFKDLDDIRILDMPQQTCDIFNKTAKFQANDLTSRGIKIYDKFLNTWKQLELLSPRWHVNNFVGNVFNSYLGMTETITKPKMWKKSFDILRTGDPKQTIKLGGVEYSYLQLKHMAQTLGVTEGQVMNEGIDTISKITPIEKAFETNMKIGNTVEGTGRMTLFINALDNGFTPEEAVEIVNKYLFDYSDLSTFEKTTMKRLVPFYAWLKKNAVLQAQSFFDMPTKYSNLYKASKSIDSQNDDYIESAKRNEYRLFSQQIPGLESSKGGWGLKNILPFMDMDKYSPTGLVNQTVLKTPIELLTGKSVDGVFDSTIPAILAHQTAPTGAAYDAYTKFAKGDVENGYAKIAQFLGIPIETIRDQSASEEQIKYAQDLANRTRKTLDEKLYNNSYELSQWIDENWQPSVKQLNNLINWCERKGVELNTDVLNDSKTFHKFYNSMWMPSEEQENYIKSLCERAGIEYDPSRTTSYDDTDLYIQEIWQPSQAQVNYIAYLCNLKGIDPQTVIFNLTSQNCNDVIDALKNN